MGRARGRGVGAPAGAEPLLRSRSGERRRGDAGAGCHLRTSGGAMREKRLPRRVLMTADTIGGVWGYSMLLAKGLASHGVRVTIAVMGERVSDEQRAEAAALGNVDLETRRYRLEWMRDPWRDVDRAGEWLLRLAAKTRA